MAVGGLEWPLQPHRQMKIAGCSASRIQKASSNLIPTWYTWPAIWSSQRKHLKTMVIRLVSLQEVHEVESGKKECHLKAPAGITTRYNQ